MPKLIFIKLSSPNDPSQLFGNIFSKDRSIVANLSSFLGDRKGNCLLITVHKISMPSRIRWEKILNLFLYSFLTLVYKRMILRKLSYPCQKPMHNLKLVIFVLVVIVDPPKFIIAYIYEMMSFNLSPAFLSSSCIYFIKRWGWLFRSDLIFVLIIAVKINIDWQ